MRRAAARARRGRPRCSARCGSSGARSSSTSRSRRPAAGSPRRTRSCTRSARGTARCCARTPRTSCSARRARRRGGGQPRRRAADLPGRPVRPCVRPRALLDRRRRRRSPSGTGPRVQADAAPVRGSTTAPSRCSSPGASRGATEACRSGAAPSRRPSAAAHGPVRARRLRGARRHAAARAHRGGARRPPAAAAALACAARAGEAERFAVEAHYNRHTFLVLVTSRGGCAVSAGRRARPCPTRCAAARRRARTPWGP